MPNEPVTPERAPAFRHLDRATIWVGGPDARAWLNGVITQEVPSPGRGAYGLALSRPGKVQSDVFCLDLGDAFLVATSPRVHASLLDTWQKMLVMEDAELRDVSDAWLWVLRVGPPWPDRPPLPGAHGGELDLFGLGGQVMALPNQLGLEAFSGPWLDDQAWLELRLERLVPEFGVDFGDQERPHEASLDRLAVSWSKGCYLGQEVVCMQEMRGKVKRRLEVLKTTAPLTTVPAPGESILDGDGAVVGAVTSFSNSRRLGTGLVMARLELAARDRPLILGATGERLERLPSPA
jgi:tRNA-modifying protein YgfZ